MLLWGHWDLIMKFSSSYIGKFCLLVQHLKYFHSAQWSQLWVDLSGTLGIIGSIWRHFIDRLWDADNTHTHREREKLSPLKCPVTRLSLPMTFNGGYTAPLWEFKSSRLSSSYHSPKIHRILHTNELFHNPHNFKCPRGIHTGGKHA